MFVNHIEIWLGTPDKSLSFFIHEKLFSELKADNSVDRIKECMAKHWQFRTFIAKGVFVIVDSNRPLLQPTYDEIDRLENE